MVDPALQIALRSLLRCALEISLRLVVLAHARKRRTQVMQRVSQDLGVYGYFILSLLLSFNRLQLPRKLLHFLLQLLLTSSDQDEFYSAVTVVDLDVSNFVY